LSAGHQLAAPLLPLPADWRALPVRYQFLPPPAILAAMGAGANTGVGRSRVLLFDVLGSLLDEDAGQRRVVRQELSLSDQVCARFVEQWSARFHELVTLIQDRHEPYQTPEVLYARAAQDIAAAAHPTLTKEISERLARFGRSLDPFPEVPAALDALSRRHALVALTNAGTAQAFAMSEHAGLRWSTLISGETVQAYKPDPQMYQFAVATLELQPERCVFIAAHQWDLQAAAEHGFRTAYLDRDGDGHLAGVDFQAPNLAELVAQLD
jgi:2-haloacid dehalogenase